ncbi:MAG: hypothetical protein H7293_19370 [Candidatus Saccharibacteria bacterium]|nr:hypothetical protein [Rhodoferax sp.]
MQEQDVPPDTTEQYTSAIGASNLRVEMDSNIRSQADIIMAAAWSKSRLGSALLRLHSEWDRSQHPRRMTGEAIDRLAAELDRVQSGFKKVDGETVPNMVLDMPKAFRTANNWYHHEMGLLLGRLKTLPEVRAQLTLKAEDMGCGRPADVAAKLILWWLTRRCPTCHGTKFEVATGTGRQTGKVCRSCRGTGETQIPCFEPGRAMASFIDDCLNRARVDIRTRLRGEKAKTEGQQS